MSLTYLHDSQEVKPIPTVTFVIYELVSEIG